MARAETRRINVRITVEAEELLNQLAPSENKRGAYISGLIMRAAQEAGLSTAPSTYDLATLQVQLQAAQRQLQAVQTQYDDLVARVTAALHKHEQQEK